MKIVWLLILSFYHLDAASPVITASGIASKEECYALAEKIKKDGWATHPDVDCIPYEVSR